MNAIGGIYRYRYRWIEAPCRVEVEISYFLDGEI